MSVGVLNLGNAFLRGVHTFNGSHEGKTERSLALLERRSNPLHGF